MIKWFKRIFRKHPKHVIHLHLTGGEEIKRILEKAVEDVKAALRMEKQY